MILCIIVFVLPHLYAACISIGSTTEGMILHEKILLEHTNVFTLKILS